METFFWSPELLRFFSSCCFFWQINNMNSENLLGLSFGTTWHKLWNVVAEHLNIFFLFFFGHCLFFMFVGANIIWKSNFHVFIGEFFICFRDLGIRYQTIYMKWKLRMFHEKRLLHFHQSSKIIFNYVYSARVLFLIIPILFFFFFFVLASRVQLGAKEK